MGEKIYKTMRGSGAMNLAIGIITLVVGVTCGILMIIAGARLLAEKSKIMI